MIGIRAIACMALAFALVGCTATVRDRIYQPVPLAQTPVEFAGEAPTSLTTTTADGLSLQGYFWQPAEGNETLVVYFHGNGNNQLVGAARAEPLRAGGHGVLAASYRGYGGNPGSPSETGLMTDAEAWLAEARRLAPGARIYLFGHSLGGAMALEMAARHDVAGVATLGTFARLADRAPSAVRGMIPDRYDNVTAIAKVEEPLLLIHGSEDRTVAYAAAEELERASGGHALLARLPGAGHQVDFARLADRIWAFWETGERGN